MKYRTFGRSGLRVSEVCLGTMTFGDESGDWGAGRRESEKIFHAYVEAGGNFVDTANGYTDGRSEQLTGNFVAPMRERIVLATKYSFNTRPGDPNAGGNHRKNLIQALDASLRRLKTGYVDLYWVHVWDFTTPVDEVMRALDDQVRAGKILHVGISDAPAWIVAQANTLASLRGWTSFVGVQVEYNLAERTVERDIIPMARSFDLGVAAWSPLAGGLLTGKYLTNGKATSQRATLAKRHASERSDRTVRELLQIAQARGVRPEQVALAWLASRGNDVFPILGAKTLEQYERNVAFLSLTLHDDELRSLDEVSAVELGFPQQFFADVMAGKMPGSIFGVPRESMVL